MSLDMTCGPAVRSMLRFGQRDQQGLQEAVRASFLLILALTLLLNLAAFLCLDGIRGFMQVPTGVWAPMRAYLRVIFSGIFATFLYNFFASLLRALGNSVTPLIFLALSALLNITLDLWFVLGLSLGPAGAAWATVIAQYVSGVGIGVYALLRLDCLKTDWARCRVSWGCIRQIANFSVLTRLQQSVMNLGILLVQGIVNGFGPAVMAAFAAAVKIDAFAYMPVQDFGTPFPPILPKTTGPASGSASGRGCRVSNTEWPPAQRARPRQDLGGFAPNPPPLLKKWTKLFSAPRGPIFSRL